MLQRGDGPVPLLGHLPRRLPDLLPDALSRADRRAAPLQRARRHGASLRNRRTTSTPSSASWRWIVGFAQLVFLFNMIWSIRHGKEAGGNPWRATSLEWQTAETPPAHGNFGKELPVVYRWAYDYSVPGAKEDFIPQNEPGRLRRLQGPLMSVILVFLLVIVGDRRLVAVAAKADVEAVARSRDQIAAFPDTESGTMPAAKIGSASSSPWSAACSRCSPAPISCAWGCPTGAPCRCRGCCGSTPACWC